ncbi:MULTISPECIES: acetylglutamate kinase [Prochlorococcus]|uniref:Acetylglutamate kinase n=1 Tax=Prochlorococcus marinus (strain SARG / CCMP1375 / SS120) TaxID=167539 RepID=ARGB_PROMA|nr:MULTISPECIES: acetylglutamate kinase [Prochlorococcus]Q7VD84.1 RecName: Full=Acetylglutamate kinase; AltName: Full=N-acetyl-L-glutamate 5-phosphotransferase; AltName: Full=NAG kinase; Short=NAGK [Prochlorococcus marinus subsp. marinus str. CCMP1375]AAP99544.1 Acetylglutamate kinase [Prochlorococcus marinus subsp. marinus str. CCMP1375]KGG11183.1 Acetylglutamate kinase [Prochlorococcus marinus str. LG]KGG21521.1 Acetylglutamate kinase [Prochlorococcus marinus str. SS2]KGG23134.1 Acetylglutam
MKSNNLATEGINSLPLDHGENDAIRVSVLSEALPYIQKFAGRRIVIKYGGSAMSKESLKEAVFRDIALLSSVGAQPVIIHGGGPEINHWLTKLEIKSEFRDGLRITDSNTMDIVEMVLIGRVNKQIVNGINKVGASAVGLCGIDGKLIEARPWGDGSYGLVGEVARVNADVIEPLIANGYIPVISSVASSVEGINYNINADTVAGEIAAAIGAEKLILLTDTSGILKNKSDPLSLIQNIRLSDMRELIDKEVVNGGMTPKAECCIRALAQGVNAAHIIDGRIPHALLLEVFTDKGIGTMIVSRS